MRPLLASHRRVLALVWVVAAAYLANFVTRGWIPGDEGLLGQTAERVLLGELPHRDFGDMYTGGLAFFHALAFRILGIRLTSIRWFLFGASLVFVPVVYRIAARVAGPLLCAGVTLLCVVWSMPNYFASLPSWYNLFLAAGGTLALIKHVEDGRRRWLFVAGLCGGVSFLFKSAGLLFVAAVFLFFVYREGQLDREARPAALGRAFSWFLTAGLVVFTAVLTSLIAMQPRPMEIFSYVVPGLGLGVLLVRNEWRGPSGGFEKRFRRLLALNVPFVAGLLVPVGVFLIPYLAGSGLGALLDGDFLFSKQRLQYTTYALPGPATVICVLPMLVLLAHPLLRLRSEVIDRKLFLPAVLCSAVIVAFGSNLYVYQTVWFSIRPLVPVAVMIGCIMLARSDEALSGERRQLLFLLLVMAAMISIVQFPFAWGIYFCYAAPMLILAILYLVRSQPGAPRRLHLCAMGLYFSFAAVWLNLGWVEAHSRLFTHRSHDTRLAIDRGGLWVTAEDAERYQRLVAEIRRRSPEGAAIYATPDCPEVYFLSARRNPTGTFADYFEDDFMTPERTSRLLGMLDEHEIDLVVLHWRPAFSPLSNELAAAVVNRYPHRLAIYPFTLHWRERSDQVSRRPRDA
ncbi:MAG: glycosyltransferase family 39 protein [bacterium]|nr:glycosyltransferase family 39 protein [bacterium]